MDLDVAEREAAGELGWRPIAGGMGVSFPPETRYLDEAYANFEVHAPTIVLQLIGTAELVWEPALSATLAALESVDVDWYFAGSTALAVRGVDIVPKDIDLVTDASGAHTLEAALHRHLVQPLVATPGWIADSFTRAFLGVRVEWVGGVSPAIDEQEPADFGPAAAARLEEVRWNGHALRVPPIDLQLQVTRRRGREERAVRIERWKAYNRSNSSS
jgi:hypothetical protein